jgi:hypothetical protein
MLLLPVDPLRKNNVFTFMYQLEEKLLPDKKQMPGTAGGTVRCNAVTVARATSSDAYFFLQPKPIFNKKCFVVFLIEKLTSSDHIWFKKCSF